MIHPSNIRLRDYAKHLDGLLLQGGAAYRRKPMPRPTPAPSGRAIACATCTARAAARVRRVRQTRARRVPRLPADQRRVRWLAVGHRHRRADRECARERALRPASSRDPLPGFVDACEHVPGAQRSDRQLDPPSGDPRSRPRSEHRGRVGRRQDHRRHSPSPFAVRRRRAVAPRVPSGRRFRSCSTAPLLDAFLRAARETRLQAASFASHEAGRIPTNSRCGRFVER